MQFCDLFVGRFQPFHLGHSLVVQQMDNPVIAVIRGPGTSKDQERNPFLFPTQYALIKKAHPKAVVHEFHTGYVPDIILCLRFYGLDVKNVWRGDPNRNDYDRQLETYNKDPKCDFMPTPPKLDVEVKLAYGLDNERLLGVSATLVREVIRLGNQRAFQDMMPYKLWSEWDYLRASIT